MDDRLLDAACNRLREGLRVLEDHARFIADDVEASARLKAFRHEVNRLERDLDIDRSRRDAEGDVGRHLAAPASSRRTGDADVAAASWSRVQECLRSLEEHLKPRGAALSRRAEKLRYTAYEIQTFASRRRARQWGVYALITEALSTHRLEDLVPKLIRGGVGAIQLREKDLGDRKLLTRARRLKRLVGRANVHLILNDRPDIAVLAGFDGVHVGQSDITPTQIRSLHGRRLFVGLSTHSPKQAAAAVRQGADYIGIGPVFPTVTKPHLKFIGTGTVRKMVKAAGDLPHVCIGGITPDNAPDVIGAGARGLALCTGLIAVKSPRATARRLLKLF